MIHSSHELDVPEALGSVDDPATHDALADLFLAPSKPAPHLRLAGTAAPTTPNTPAAAPATPLVECLILGHLPVLAAAWVLQYAKHAADTTHTRVGVVRVQSGQTWVDVVHPRGDAPQAQSRIGPAAAASLREAIGIASRDVARWIVRVDEPDEPALIRAAGGRPLTLLTGADDAAVVASYRAIKNICLAGHAPDDQDEPAPALRVAVIGADDARAADAEHKIAAAARTFLNGSIDCVARVAKISPGTTQPLYRGSDTLPIADLLALLARRSPATPTTPEPDAPSQPAEDASPTPTPAPTSPSPSVDDASLLGLSPIAFPCPDAPGVTLASGPGGTLHLVAPLASDQPASHVGPLLAAAAWAERHSALLQAALPGRLAPAADQGPTLHVMVRDARLARALLDTGLRVHLIVEFAPGGPRVARELN